MNLKYKNQLVKVNSDNKFKREKYLTGILSERLKDLDPYANDGTHILSF